MSAIRNLLDRRFPQLLGLYLGGCWGLIEVSDWTVERYLLSKHWVDAVLILCLGLLPTVALLAWYHGTPGRDQFRRVEKIAIPLNLVLVLGLLVSQLAGKPLGRAGEVIEITNEDGQAVERLLPNKALRTHVSVFAWRNASGDPSLDWLQYGLPLMLERDLEQDAFVQVGSIFGYGTLQNLRRAGFEDALGVPVALQCEIAEEQRNAFTVDGEFNRDSEGRFEAKVEVYRVRPTLEVAQHRLVDEDPTRLIDRLSVLLKKDFDVQKGSSRLADDLPIAQHLSPSLSAIEFWVRAQTAWRLDNDFATATAEFRRAVAEDPTFALAQLSLALTLVRQSLPGEAQGALENARQHSYRLLDRERYALRSQDLVLAQKFDELEPLYEQWIELYPQDTTALSATAYYRIQRNQLEPAQALLERVLELDPSDDRVLLTIAGLQQAQGDFAGALAKFQGYAKLHPERFETYLSMGGLSWKLGELAAAEAQFEKAALRAPDDPTPGVYLGALAMAKGKMEVAEQRFESALGLARTPPHRALVLANQLGLSKLLGQDRAAFENLPQLLGEMAKFLDPLTLALTESGLIPEVYFEVDRAEEARQRLDQLTEGLRPPFDQGTQTGYATLALLEGDSEAAQVHLEAAEELIDQLNLETIRHSLFFLRGRYLELLDEPVEAAENFRQASELFARSTLSNQDFGSAVLLKTSEARCWRQAGRLDQAEAALEESLQLFPAYPEALLELARLHLDRGMAAEARRALDRALEIWSHADLGHQLSRQARELQATLEQ